MNKLTRRTALGLAMPATMLALAGCKVTTATSMGDMNQADLDFVTNGWNLVHFNIAESELAQSYATTPAVREFAAKLLADSHLAQQAFDPVIQELGITPPSELRSDLRIRLLHIRLDHGLDFDRSFIDDQLASHEEFLSRYDMMKNTPGQNPKLLALIARATPRFQSNLNTLRELQRMMPPAGPATGPLGVTLPPPPPGLPVYGR